MKNLKRALSFAVAAIMLVGLMAVGTSAFTDDADIENTEAVNIMNQLGIILGKPDGNFDPTATVSRAEMAKMICVALNGGKDPKLESEGTLYPDTKGNWAAGYIDYCTNLGIVAGSTDGNFYPGNPVTGTEAAKMILIALGYDAKNEKFVNDANWSLNINIRANQKDLYDELAILPAAPLSRDDAAQMIFNGMDAEMVEYDYQLNTVDGNLVSVAVAKDNGKTIMTEKFNLKYFTATLTDATYDEDKDEYTYTYAGAQDENGVAYGPVSAQRKNSADFSDLYMQQVKVLYKNDTSKKMYGMYAVDSTVLAEATVADVDTSDWAADNKVIDVDGTEVETDVTNGNLPVYSFLNGAESALNTYAGVAGNAPFAIKVIDNDGDDKADLAVVYPYVVAKVTYVGKTSVTLDHAIGSLKFEDHNIYAGIAEDDFVVFANGIYTTTPDKNTVTKAPTMTGKVEAVKGTDGVKVDGEWYTDLSSTTWALNTEYDLVVVNGYIYDAAETEDAVTLSSILYVTNVDTYAGDTSLTAFTQKIKVMFTDGTTAIVTADKLGGTKIQASNTLTGAGLYKFTKDDDGNYELETITAGSSTSDFEEAAVTGNKTMKDGKLNDGTRFNDDSVIFVTEADNDVKLVKGADIKKWADNVAVNSTNLYVEAVDGFKYVVVGTAAVATNNIPSAVDSTGYGLIVATTTKVKVGSDVYAEITIWNGTEQVVVREKGISDVTVAKYAKGQLITFDKLADNKVENVAAVGVLGAVSAYDGTYITFDNGSEYEIDDDTVVIYIDSAKVAGVEGGKIAVASKDENDALIENVYYLTNDTTKTVIALFVDVNNEMDDEVVGQ